MYPSRLMLFVTLGVALTAAAAFGPVAAAQPGTPSEPAAQPSIEGGASETLPEVVARIGEDTITREEFEAAEEEAARMMSRMYQQRTGAAPATPPQIPPAMRQRLLDRMIRAKLMEIVAKELGIVVTEEEFKEALDRGKSAFPSEEEFQNFLKENNLTEKDIAERVRQQVLSGKLVDNQSKDVTVTEEELKEAYDRAKAQGLMGTPETADVAHILVKVDSKNEADWAVAKEKIDTARKRIVDDGEDFGEVAKEVSDDPGSKARGGTYPQTPRGKMVPEFDTRMWDTPIGEVSEPFRTQFGWHILTVAARHAPVTVSFEEAHDTLSEQLLAQKGHEKAQALIEEAYQRLGVQTFLPDVPAPTQGATSSPASQPAKQE